MFALPLAGFRGAATKPPLWLRGAAASGFLVTLLYCAFSIFPILAVTSWLSFGAKIAGVVAGANLLGASFYWMGSRRRSLLIPGVAR